MISWTSVAEHKSRTLWVSQNNDIYFLLWIIRSLDYPTDWLTDCRKKDNSWGHYPGLGANETRWDKTGDRTGCRIEDTLWILFMINNDLWIVLPPAHDATTGCHITNDLLVPLLLTPRFPPPTTHSTPWLHNIHICPTLLANKHRRQKLTVSNLFIRPGQSWLQSSTLESYLPANHCTTLRLRSV